MQLIVKQVPTKFVVLDNGKEVNLGHLNYTLEDFIENRELKNYEVRYPEVANILVDMGYIKIENGPRMAKIYVADTGKLSLLYGDLQDLEA